MFPHPSLKYKCKLLGKADENYIPMLIECNCSDRHSKKNFCANKIVTNSLKVHNSYFKNIEIIFYLLITTYLCY